ncbi:hypothetical protein ANN_19716 [Periplaneta americana]|uniref:Uncharacterized protein n=1 Tax=Periplaneta americana TaxID=6978 RepID=A0ABQ8SBS3_PERAM|nr:hypothetical protein ANN_19716 [Periplaneta americana]
MAGLCEGGNELPGSLKAINKLHVSVHGKLNCIDAALVPLHITARMRLSIYGKCFPVARSNSRNKAQLTHGPEPTVDHASRKREGARETRRAPRSTGEWRAEREGAAATQTGGDGRKGNDGTLGHGREGGVKQLRLRGEIQRSLERRHPLGICRNFEHRTFWKLWFSDKEETRRRSKSVVVSIGQRAQLVSLGFDTRVNLSSVQAEATQLEDLSSSAMDCPRKS